MLLLALAAQAVLGCAVGVENVTTEQLRDDLTVQTHFAKLEHGRTRVLNVVVPEDVVSILIEVKGPRVKFFLDRFVVPDTRADLAYSSSFVTHSANSVPGFVNWLFPNDSRVSTVASGTYQVQIRAESLAGTPVDGGEVEVRFYMKRGYQAPSECGLKLDFVVDSKAIAEEDTIDLVDILASRIQTLYAQIGVSVIDYQIARGDLLSANLRFEPEMRQVLRLVDDIIVRNRQPTNSGEVTFRDDAIHVIVVRSLGSRRPTSESSDSENDFIGYSMGLPGPVDADRPNAAILIATEGWADSGQVDGDLMATTLAHELGHYLGLYHTSEKDGYEHDPIPDTPECSESGSCDAGFSTNLMTQGGALRNTLTAGQGAVIRRHPLCLQDDGPSVGNHLGDTRDTEGIDRQGDSSLEIECDEPCDESSVCALSDSQSSPECLYLCEDSSSCLGSEECLEVETADRPEMACVPIPE